MTGGLSQSARVLIDAHSRAARMIGAVTVETESTAWLRRAGEVFRGRPELRDGGNYCESSFLTAQLARVPQTTPRDLRK